MRTLTHNEFLELQRKMEEDLYRRDPGLAWKPVIINSKLYWRSYKPSLSQFDESRRMMDAVLLVSALIAAFAAIAVVLMPVAVTIFRMWPL